MSQDVPSQGAIALSAASDLTHFALRKNYVSQRSSSADKTGNGDSKPIAPGASLTIADLEGPGEITHIWSTIASGDQYHLKNLVIRIYWDGNNFPSVESPVGDFFGLGHARYYVFNNPVQAIGTDHGMNSFWPMPFAKSARVVITNEGTVPTGAYYYYVDWRKYPSFPEGLFYFHAQYHQAYPCDSGKPYLIMQTAGGSGHFMGVNLSILTNVSGWWGEGDDLFTVDDDSTVTLWGTGSEDYFCGAWGFGKTFYNDYFGMPYRLRMDHDAQNLWNVYRLHLESPVAFTKSLKVEIEHGAAGFDETRAGSNNDYSSCAYWYMDKPTALSGMLPPAKARAPRIKLVLKPGQFKASEMTITKPENADLSTQTMTSFTEGTWLGDTQLFASKLKEGEPVTLEFNVPQKLQGPISLGMTKAADYATVKVQLDDQVVLPAYNAYNDGVTNETVKGPAVTLKPGTHRLKVTITGKDPRSSNTFWGMDFIEIPVAPKQAPEPETKKPAVKAKRKASN